MPFRIRPVELNSLATQIVYVDLVDLDEAEATQAVLRALDISRTRAAASPPWPKGEAAKSLIEAASPKAVLTEDKKIDAGPNPVFDLAVADDDLPTLPVRQRAIIRTIIEDLPPNAPKSVRNALKEYDTEILARILRPILGLLNDMADIIEAGVKAQNAKAEWLEDSMAKAFEKFSANHELFRKHFPLDERREATYGAVQIDEEAAQATNLRSRSGGWRKPWRKRLKRASPPRLSCGSSERCGSLLRLSPRSRFLQQTHRLRKLAAPIGHLRQNDQFPGRSGSS